MRSAALTKRCMRCKKNSMNIKIGQFRYLGLPGLVNFLEIWQTASPNKSCFFLNSPFKKENAED